MFRAFEQTPVEIEYSNTTNTTNSRHTTTKVEQDDTYYDGPVDLDEMFMPSNLEHMASDDGSLFSDDDEDGQETLPMLLAQTQYFNNPNKRVSSS